MVWRSFLSSAPILPQESYLDSFLYATSGEIEEEGGMMPLITQNAYLGANIVPENTSLASILPETPKKSTLYDLVNVGEKPKTCKDYDNQCVRFTEKLMGMEFNTDAYKIKPNTKEPCVGCAILLPNHIAYVISIATPSLEIIEQNHIDCGIINTRSIDFEEVNIRGYVKPINSF